mgnify:FL=1
MSKLKDNLLKLINKIFKKKNNKIESLPPTQSEKLLKEFTIGGIIKDFEGKINNGLNIVKLDSLYGKKLGTEKYIYNLPLSSKLSENQTISLAKHFFASLGTVLSNKANRVLSGEDNQFKFVFEKYGQSIDRNENPREAEVTNFSEVYCPIRGDLRDLYSVVHEVTHTFDLSNGDTEARKIFGEIAPQCMERMLDEYLLNLSDGDIQKYGLDRNILIQDVRNRQMSTFLSRKDNIKSFNNGTGNKELDLRYILAQIYSSEYMKLDRNTRTSELLELIKSIESNDSIFCSKAFGIDLKNKLKMQFIMSDIVKNIKKTNNQILLQEKSQEILATSRKGKDFRVSIGNKNVYINLESKIPFILITPSHLENGQTLVMESNNLETNNKELLLKQALNTGKELNDILNGSNPILIPILPSESPTAPYYQQLSTECFENGKRPDLDIVEVINKAKEIMDKEYGTKVTDKIFLNGYSSSGCFAQRFSLIHPELIDTACIGGSSGSIPIPNTGLDYPLGIKNYEELFGKSFNIEEYRKITFDYYVGSLECEIKSLTRTDEDGNLAPMHDMSYFNRSVPSDIGRVQRKNLGQDMFERAEKTVDILKNMGINISHRIIPNRTHNNKEAIELMRNNPDYKNIKGIHDEQRQIISSSFRNMLQRQNSMKKENNEILKD